MQIIYWLLIIAVFVLGYYYYINQEPFSGYIIEPFTGYNIEPFTSDDKKNALYVKKKFLKEKIEEFQKFTANYENKINELNYNKKITIGDLAKKKINDELNKLNSDYNNKKRQYNVDKERLERDIKDTMIKENLTDPDEIYTVNERDKINYYISQNPTNRPPPQKFIGVKKDAAFVDLRGAPKNFMKQLINDESMGKNPFAPGQVNEYTRLDLIESSSGLTSGNLSTVLKGK